jgi:hypothetical protein
MGDNRIVRRAQPADVQLAEALRAEVDAYPIESTFATVRHRTKIIRGPGSRAAFESGKLVERPDEHHNPAAA